MFLTEEERLAYEAWRMMMIEQMFGTYKLPDTPRRPEPPRQYYFKYPGPRYHWDGDDIDEMFSSFKPDDEEKKEPLRPPLKVMPKLPKNPENFIPMLTASEKFRLTEFFAYYKEKELSPCGICRGTGKQDGKNCNRCNGIGKY